MKKLLRNVSLLSLIIGATFSLQNNASSNAIETSAASLPTSINLKNNTDKEIRAYYSDLNDLSEEERRGTNLLKNLKTILIKNFKYYGYDDVWQIYEITDRDWTLSPAENDTSGDTVYDSSTNSYTKYTYGTSSSNVGNNPYIHAIYRDQTSDNRKIRAWDDHTSEDKDGVDYGYLNREHVWPQSYGFKASSGAKGPAGTDVHHLMAADGPVNSSLHNNNIYGFVDTNDNEEYTSGDSANATEDNKRGKSVRSYINSTVFEPIDENKGDIARATFYMCAMYNSYDGSEPSSFNPNLALSNKDVFTDSSITTSKNSPAEYGLLNDLLAWNYMDSVDEYETHRNNLIYNNYQYNRNPFVDFPQWADLIWGDKNVEGCYANPATDVIGGNQNSDYVVLSESNYTLPLSSSIDIVATTNASSISITTSDPNNVISATVNDKVISVTSNSNNIGTAVITVTAGNSSTTCSITVTNSIILNKDSIYLNTGESTTITANEEVSWSVDNSLLTLSETTGTTISLSASEIEEDVDVILTASKDGKYPATCTVHLLAEVFNDESASIVFPSNNSSSDGSGISGWNNNEHPFPSGYKYLSISSDASVEAAKFNKVYYGKSGYGLKLGTNEISGSLTIVLNQSALNGLKISSINIETSPYYKNATDKDKATFNVDSYIDETNYKSISFDPSDGGTMVFENPTSLTKIIFSADNNLKSQKRAYLKSVTFNFYSIDTFASDFMDLTDDGCAYSKLNNWVDVSDKLSNVWPTASTKYDYLSDTQKSKVVETTASEESDATTIQTAMARYDHIIRRYESETINNFIGRGTTSNRINLIANDDDFAIALIVAIALFSITICSGFIVVKKHKRD